LRSRATIISSASASDHHLLGQRILQRPLLRVGGDDVVDGREGPRGKAHRLIQLAQHREGLGARDLVDQVQPDEELGLSARQLAHRVKVPDLVEEIPAAHGDTGVAQRPAGSDGALTGL
jgi:hypothetical protein